MFWTIVIFFEAFLENNKFCHQVMEEINGAAAIYLMLNICLTAKTICAIDLSNNTGVSNFL